MPDDVEYNQYHVLFYYKDCCEGSQNKKWVFVLQQPGFNRGDEECDTNRIVTHHWFSSMLPLPVGGG